MARVAAGHPVIPSAKGVIQLEMASLPSMVLASASPRRVFLLRELGANFETLPADVEELTSDAGLPPEELALENARRKARAVAVYRPETVVLGADTIVAFENRIFGKPRDFAEAEAMLCALGGREHRVVTAVCLVRKCVSQEVTFCETSYVTLRNLSEPQRRVYLQRIQPLDKAGAYAAQDDRGELIASLRGSVSNVIGLPLEALRLHLAQII